MSEQDAKTVVLRFVDCINSEDPEGLMALQTDDFTFTSYSEEIFVGRDGWHDYFTSYPDYKIHVDRLITSGNGLLIK
ncbi:nuclear transport factor 2 family protein [Candidatus Thorarchaeota archaeon]|nr:MAG: nuclear transport factor 2 family protein [Candidatus Thorarchaeota archaeon]